MTFDERVAYEAEILEEQCKRAEAEQQLNEALHAASVEATEADKGRAEIDRLKADYRRASMSNDVNWKAYKAMKQQRDAMKEMNRQLIHERDEARALLAKQAGDRHLMTPPRETPDCKKMRQRLDGKTSSERARYVVRLVQEARDATLAEVEQIFPTNWCDSLLTGPDKVLHGENDCRDIERLIAALKEKVAELRKGKETDTP